MSGCANPYCDGSGTFKGRIGDGPLERIVCGNCVSRANAELAAKHDAWLALATDDQIERANAAVAANMAPDGSEFFRSAMGHACALTAIMQADATLAAGARSDETLQAAQSAGRQSGPKGNAQGDAA